VLADLVQLARRSILADAGSTVGLCRSEQDVVGVQEGVGHRLPHGEVDKVGAVVGRALANGTDVPGVLRATSGAAALDVHAAVAGAAARERPAQRLDRVPFADGHPPTRAQRRLGGVPCLLVHERRHGQCVVHTLQLLMQLTLISRVP
jgi:hypothetical protein